jgi:hypothetical protein
MKIKVKLPPEVRHATKISVVEMSVTNECSCHDVLNLLFDNFGDDIKGLIMNQDGELRVKPVVNNKVSSLDKKDGERYCIIT